MTVGLKKMSDLLRKRIAVAAYYFVPGVVFASWASRIPDVKQMLHLTNGQLGSVLFAIPIGQLLMMAFSGVLVSKFGSKKMILLAEVLYALVLFSMGSSSTVFQLILSLVAFGMMANQHVAKMVETRIANTNSPWLAGVEVGDIHAIPVSHGEGKFVVTAEEFAELRDNGQIFTQYVDFEGKPSMDSKYNPNGSVNAIEGITSKNGQIIGKMGHSERFEDGLFQNIPGNKDQHLFASAVKYFTGK